MHDIRAVVIQDQETLSKFCSKDGKSRVLKVSFPATNRPDRPNAEVDILVVACLDEIKEESTRKALLDAFEEPRGLASLFDGKDEEQGEATEAAIDNVSQERNLVQEIDGNKGLYTVLKIKSWARFANEFYKLAVPNSEERLKIDTVRGNLMKKYPCGKNAGKFVKYMFTRIKVDSCVRTRQRTPIVFKAVAFKVDLSLRIPRDSDVERLLMQNVVKKELWGVEFESTIVIKKVTPTEQVVFETQETRLEDARTALMHHMKGLLGLGKKGVFKKLRYNTPGKWDYVDSESRDKIAFRYTVVSGSNNKNATYFILVASSDARADFGRFPGSSNIKDETD